MIYLSLLSWHGRIWYEKYYYSTYKDKTRNRYMLSLSIEDAITFGSVKDALDFIRTNNIGECTVEELFRMDLKEEKLNYEEFV